MVKLQIQTSPPAKLRTTEQEQVPLRIGSQVHAIDDYTVLKNKPQIEGVELIGNKTFADLHLTSLSNTDIEQLLSLT